MNWFYIDESVTDGDRRKGPFSSDEILSLYNEGKIQNATLVWHYGLENWIPLEQANLIPTEDDVLKMLQNAHKIIEENKAKERPPRFAGFWIRLLAYLLDFCILSIISLLLLMVFSQIGLIDTEAANSIISQNAETILNGDYSKLWEVRGLTEFISICSFLQLFYFVFFNARYSGTPGKIFLKLKIVWADGSRLGLKGAIIRYFFSMISSLTLVYLYGFAYVITLVDPEKRALHDWLARTRVTYSESEK